MFDNVKLYRVSLLLEKHIHTVLPRTVRNLINTHIFDTRHNHRYFLHIAALVPPLDHIT
jgi:hypothetical protein